MPNKDPRKSKGKKSREIVTKDSVRKAGGFYKSYDIEWLRGVPEHPDYYLVAEYDELEGDTDAELAARRRESESSESE